MKKEETTPQTEETTQQQTEAQQETDRKAAQWARDEAEGKDWRNPAHDDLIDDTDW